MNIHKKTVVTAIIFMLIAGTVPQVLSESNSGPSAEEAAITIEDRTVTYVGEKYPIRTQNNS